MPGCSKSESYIKGEIEKASYCTTEKDCVDAGSKCPFGCYAYANNKEADRIKNLISSYQFDKFLPFYLCVRLHVLPER